MLSACVSQPDLPVAWQQHQTTISGLEYWQLQSKFGYSNGEDSGSAWLHWKQHGDQSEALLSGPFGSGTAQLLSSSQGAILKRSGQADLLANSAEELTYYLFGWQLPIAQMRYWVRGIPSPDLAVEALSTKPNGLLAELEQGKWTLTFINYQNTPLGPLPGKIQARSGSLQIKLVIKEWRLQPTPPIVKNSSS